jgi:hypothetical protein
MTVKELIKALQSCNGNWEIILPSEKYSDDVNGIAAHRATQLYCGYYNYAERDCAPGSFINSGLDIDGKDLNSVLIR